MKKILTTLAAAGLALAPALALAASIQLSASQTSVVAGETFTVTVTAAPSGAPLYTASANILFNPSLLEAESFSYGPNWMTVSQNGYDTIDNNGGSLTKTAGLPGGFLNPTILGTVTFKAKAPGTATITVSGNSQLLDGGSNNALSGTQGAATVSIASAPAQTQNAVTVPTPTGNTTTPPGSSATTSTSTATSTGAGQTAAAGLVATGSQEAAAGSAFAGVPTWVWWIILAIVVIGGGYWIWRQFFSKKS